MKNWFIIRLSRQLLPEKAFWFFLLAASVLLLFANQGCYDKTSRPVMGQKAPDFSCRCINDSRQELSQFKGNVVLIRFWADWCRSCVKEMPIIDKYYRSAKNKGFVVLAVNVKQSRADIEAFARKFKLSFPIVLDEEGKITKIYDVKRVPTHFLIDRDGIIRSIYLGPIGDENELAKFLEPYL